MYKKLMKREILDKLLEVVDDLETEYGELEGFEIKLDHPVSSGEKGPTEVSEFVILHLQRTKIQGGNNEQR